MRRVLLLLAALALASVAVAVDPDLPGLAHAAQPRASLTDIESDVMCVSCKEPLAVAQSPQAYAERNFIRSLIARGMTKSQIEQALVSQYGTAVLGKPPAHGFNLTVYILPPALVLAGAALLAFTLPRWRRRTRAAQADGSIGGADGGAPPLGPEDARRLDEDLARHP
jgi:cytochrome c-type biogenesis protein CcmH